MSKKNENEMKKYPILIRTNKIKINIIQHKKKNNDTRKKRTQK